MKVLTLLVLIFLGYCIFPYELVKQIISLPDKFIELPIFSKYEVEIEGVNKLSTDEIMSLSGLNDIQSILEVNLNEVHDNLALNSWIENIEILRIFPSKIKIIIEEKKPHAIWWDKGKFLLIDSKGDIIEQVHQDSLNYGYLLVVGEKANRQYYVVENMLFHRKLLPEVLSLARVGNRRWDLYLRDDILVKLPEQEIDQALDILSEILKHGKNSVSVIDLRLSPDKIYIEFKNKK